MNPYDLVRTIVEAEAQIGVLNHDMSTLQEQKDAENAKWSEAREAFRQHPECLSKAYMLANGKVYYVDGNGYVKPIESEVLREP